MNSSDWVSIVEFTRILEEQARKLQDDRITEDGSSERAFLEIIHSKKTQGYRAALDLKAREEKMKQEETEKLAAVSPTEEQKLKLRNEDSAQRYGISQLKAAGYSDPEILNVSFPLSMFWAYNFSAVHFRKRGVPPSKLLEVGYTEVGR
jgi:hypothetical protein